MDITARDLVATVGGRIDEHGDWVCPDCAGESEMPCPATSGFDRKDGIAFCRDCDSGYFDFAEDGRVVPCPSNEIEVIDRGSVDPVTHHKPVSCKTCYPYV